MVLSKSVFTDTKELGRQGENIACRLLKEKGFKVLVRNYSSRQGEIDIVARDGKTLVFVEVKARSSAKYGYPQDAVTKKKGQRIRKVALSYLKKIGWEGDCRFDVVSLFVDAFGRAKNIELIKDAF